VKVASLDGTRNYIRPCLAKVLPHKNNLFKQLKVVLKVIDFGLSLVNPLPIIVKFFSLKGIGFQYLNNPDEEVISIYSKAAENTPSVRNVKDLEWILNHPWLVSSSLGDRVGQKYFFSSSPKRFERLLIKVYRKNDLLGIIMLNHTDGFITTPYIVCNDNDAKLFVKVLLKHTDKLGATRITVYHKLVAKQLKGLWPFGWLSLYQQRNFFATKEVIAEFGESQFQFLEGEGDCAFV
jgi:hypothetical protein